VTKNLDDDDPVIVTLHNILMVAPKADGAGANKYDQLTVRDELAQQEELIAAGAGGNGVEDDEMPLDFQDF
jgi:hypothetical protein